MTEIERKERAIRKAEALRKAQALVDQLQDEDGSKKYSYAYHFDALCRAIEQHEAFRQEVSDAINDMVQRTGSNHGLYRFMLPNPDPLVEALNDAFPDYNLGNNLVRLPDHADWLRAALAKRGLEIRDKETTDDGIALGAEAHPIAPWYKRLWSRLRHRNRINPSALKTYYIEIKDKSDG